MTRVRGVLTCAAVALWPVAGDLSARAQAVVSSGESFVDVTLLPGRIEAGGVRVAGLVVDVAPDWKTYWRNPGEAGIPPEIDWSGSRNLGAAEVLWPRPFFFDTFGLRTLGYAGRVVFPVRLVPERPGEAIEIDLALALAVCRDICVLEETQVQSRIEPGAPELGAELVAAAERAVPRPGDEVGLTAATCRISGAGAKRRFDAVLEFDRRLAEPVVVLEGPDRSWFNAVETTAEVGGNDGSRLHVAADLSLLDASAWVSRSQLRMTVLAGDFTADVQGCAAPAG